MQDSAGTICFHCRGACPPGGALSVEVDGGERSVCCAGCQAAAQLVLAQGLGSFYRFRRGAGGRPDDTGRDWTVFDREAALRRYTHTLPGGEREVGLQLEGLHCAACAWLIGSSLRALEGVSDVRIVPGAARAQIRFDPRRASLGGVLTRIHALGYAARPLGPGDDAAAAERRRALLRLAVAGLGMMQVMTFAVSLYAGALQGMQADIARLLRLVSLLVATPVVLFSARPFFAGAWRALRAGLLGMDVPVAASIGAAYVWSVGATLLGSGPVYFDSAVMFTFFLLLGRYVEMALRHRSGTQQQALASLLPVGVLRLQGERMERVTPDELRVGDCLRVLPGERIAADGIVERGSGAIDESLLTGESVPRMRRAGDALIAGTLNLDGAMDMRVQRVGQDTKLCAVVRLLDCAQASRPRLAEQADRVAGWFVAAVLVLAAATGWYWLQVDPIRAFPTMLAVLVVTCPCALSLATPAALAAASSRLARMGLLVTDGRVLERLADADRIVFDKTGTLTRGQPRLERVQVLDARVSPAEALSIAAALERFSAHPIAMAFAGVPAAAGALDAHTSAGRGIEATVGGHRYRIGSPAFVAELALAPDAAAPDAPHESPQDTHTLIALGDAGGSIALFHLGDALREDAREALGALAARGLVPAIASGDRPTAVAAAAQQLGGLEHHAGLDAAAKVALVQRLQSAGRGVVMVGDGVNDAPVLAAASVSVALGGGTDLAKVSADLVLLGAHLSPLVEAVDCARRTRAVIRQNLAWAAIYNATAVPLAALGWLQPWMAALGMSASSLLVVLNAMRLLRTPAAWAMPSGSRIAVPAAAGAVPA